MKTRVYKDDTNDKELRTSETPLQNKTMRITTRTRECRSKNRRQQREHNLRIKSKDEENATQEH
jgi:hypothetical protein